MKPRNLTTPSPSRLTAKPIVLDVPQRITNASQREPLALKQITVRAGADDHFRHRSRGMGA